MFRCLFSLICIVFMCAFFVIYIEFFPYCLFVSNSQVKTTSEMTYTVSGGALINPIACVAAYVVCCTERRIQTERQERKRVKQELGLAEPESGGRKTRFDPPEPVAAGISLGIKPLPAGILHCLMLLLLLLFTIIYHYLFARSCRHQPWH